MRQGTSAEYWLLINPYFEVFAPVGGVCYK